MSAKGGMLMESWLPTKVLIADFVDGELVTDLLEEIGDQAGLLEILVRRDGRSVGMVSLRVAGEAGTLGERVRAAAESLPTPSEAPWTKVEPATWPKAVVAIPTVFGRLEMLRLAVASLGRLDYPDFDIVLVDNRPTPNMQEYESLRSATDRHVLILHEPERGISAARNRSLLHCDAPFIAFTDDDVQVDAGWLRELVRPFVVDPNVACVSGLVIPSELTSPEQSQFEQFYGGRHRSFEPVLYAGDRPSESDPLFPYAPGRFGSGNNMAFRVSTLREFGGFDTSLGTGTPARGGEDLAAFVKILHGHAAIAIEPSAVVHHSHRATSDAFRHQVFSYGVGLSAMYSALLMESGQHRRNILRRLPSALRLFFRSGNGTVRAGSPTGSAPASLRLRQAAGIAVGPLFYLRSRRQHPKPPAIRLASLDEQRASGARQPTHQSSPP